MTRSRGRSARRPIRKTASPRAGGWSAEEPHSPAWRGPLEREFEARLREMVETVRTVFGEEHPHYATALENLASTLRKIGQFEEADAVDARAIELRDQLFIRKRRRRWRDDGGAMRPERRHEGGPQRVTPAVLDITSAARYLAISPDTLYGLVRSGEVPHARVGKSIRFRLWDLDRYLEQQTSRHWERLDRRGRPSRR